MDFSNLPMMQMMKDRMKHLNTRQKVLAENISNSDTPNYKAKDVKEFNFESYLKQTSSTYRLAAPETVGFASNASGGKTVDPAKPLAMAKSHPMHMQPVNSHDYKVEVLDDPYDTAPNGNSVVLEQQMRKVVETQIDYRMTTDLYKKQMNMIRTVLGKGR